VASSPRRSSRPVDAGRDGCDVRRCGQPRRTSRPNAEVRTLARSSRGSRLLERSDAQQLPVVLPCRPSAHCASVRSIPAGGRCERASRSRLRRASATTGAATPARHSSAWRPMWRWLRGVNVGARNRIKVRHLEAVFARLGHTSVVTYIQSGNVVFNSGPRAPSRSPAPIEEDRA